MRKHTYTVGDLFTSRSSGATVEVTAVDNANDILTVRNVEWDGEETYSFEYMDKLLNDLLIRRTTTEEIREL